MYTDMGHDTDKSLLGGGEGEGEDTKMNSRRRDSPKRSVLEEFLHIF